MEHSMLNHELRRDGGILVLKPEGPLAAADATTLASRVDAHLQPHGTLRGVLIHEKALRGWNDFGALLARLQIIKQHHRHIDRVAIVADGGFATIMPFIASHFIHAQVKHFDHAHDENAAWDWLMDNSRRQVRAAAYRDRRMVRMRDW
jgi:stage II sporulation SpoAA-like protein